VNNPFGLECAAGWIAGTYLALSESSSKFDAIRGISMIYIHLPRRSGEGCKKPLIDALNCWIAGSENLCRTRRARAIVR
jgi:hypothetical protein